MMMTRTCSSSSSRFCFSDFGSTGGPYSKGEGASSQGRWRGTSLSGSLGSHRALRMSHLPLRDFGAVRTSKPSTVFASAESGFACGHVRNLPTHPDCGNGVVRRGHNRVYVHRSESLQSIPVQKSGPHVGHAPELVRSGHLCWLRKGSEWPPRAVRLPFMSAGRSIREVVRL